MVWSDERPFFDKILENDEVYPIVYSFKPPPFAFLILCLGKPWFWEKELLFDDLIGGIVYNYMYPKAPVNPKHPALQLKNYLGRCSSYEIARNRNSRIIDNSSVKKH
jgi:hypothetical protein